MLNFVFPLFETPFSTVGLEYWKCLGHCLPFSGNSGLPGQTTYIEIFDCKTSGFDQHTLSP